MQVEYIEFDGKLEKVINSNIFSINNELKANVTLQLTTKEAEELFKSDEVIAYVYFLGDMIEIDIHDCDVFYGTNDTATVYIVSDDVLAKDEWKALSERYEVTT